MNKEELITYIIGLEEEIKRLYSLQNAIVVAINYGPDAPEEYSGAIEVAAELIRSYDVKLIDLIKRIAR